MTLPLLEITPKFPLGLLVMTRGVNDQVADDQAFALFVFKSLKRHASGDWGDMCQEDKGENDLALRQEVCTEEVDEAELIHRLRIFSAYESNSLPKIWIITEADRSATTILFPSEY